MAVPIGIQRFVTAEDEQGKAFIWKRGIPTNTKHPTPAVASTLLWATAGTPTDYTADEDAGDWVLGTAPPPGGTRVTYFTLAPSTPTTLMHRTDTLDYAICVAGRVDAHIEDSVVSLAPGDVIVIRGTNHAWANPDDVPAALVIVLVDGEPKREGSYA